MQMSQEQQSQKAKHKNSTPESKLLEIKREFHVSIGKLFEAFASSDALKIWWWPRGLYSDHIEFDFREGGKYFINMKGFHGGSGGMTGEFEEIVHNKRIVMTDQFANEKGQPISAKEADATGVWPEFVYITFDFESVGENSSRLTLSQEGIPNEGQKDCIHGWSEMFDKLESYLNAAKN